MPARQRPPSAARDLIPERPDLDGLGRPRPGARPATCTATPPRPSSARAPRAEVMLVGEQPGTARTGRAPVRRPGRPRARPGPGGRHRPRAGVRDQRRQALQVRAPGQAPPAQKPNAEEVRLLPLARVGAGRGPAPRARPAGRDRRPGPAGQLVPGQPPAGRVLDSDLAPRVLATVHPSSILRAPDEEARALAYKGFVADLAVVADELAMRGALPPQAPGPSKVQ